MPWAAGALSERRRPRANVAQHRSRPRRPTPRSSCDRARRDCAGQRYGAKGRAQEAGEAAGERFVATSTRCEGQQEAVATSARVGASQDTHACHWAGRQAAGPRGPCGGETHQQDLKAGVSTPTDGIFDMSATDKSRTSTPRTERPVVRPSRPGAADGSKTPRASRSVTRRRSAVGGQSRNLATSPRHPAPAPNTEPPHPALAPEPRPSPDGAMVARLGHRRRAAAGHRAGALAGRSREPSPHEHSVVKPARAVVNASVSSISSGRLVEPERPAEHREVARAGANGARPRPLRRARSCVSLKIERHCPSCR